MPRTWTSSWLAGPAPRERTPHRAVHYRRMARATAPPTWTGTTTWIRSISVSSSVAIAALCRGIRAARTESGDCKTMCHYSPPKSDRRAGFTLIEVLVVVSIIALLISILLPSLARARDQARAAVCLSKLRQMGIGTVSYANSYREYIPPVDPAQPDVGPKDTSSGSWGSYQVGSDDMRVYHPKWVPNLKLWECPGARNRVSKHDDLRGTYAQDDSIRLGTAYEYNPWMYDIVSRPTSWPQFVMASK